jgi:phosphate transport system substrate-binding protein
MTFKCNWQSPFEMTVLRCFTLTALLLAASAPVTRAADDDIAVLVNKTNAADNLTKAQLKKILLGDQASWPGGKKVVIVLRAAGQPDRATVLRVICGMTEAEFNEHLMKANFGGDSSGAPKVAQSPLGVRQLVMTTPGAIAFLRVSEVNDTVKVINVDGAAAGSPDYAIKTK